MASPSPAALLQLIVTQDQLWTISLYTNLSATFLWTIDFVHTLSMQIEAVWFSKLTGTAVIYLVNRYTFGISCALNLVYVSSGTASDKICSILSAIGSWSTAIAILTMNLLFALRVYAVCGQTKLILYIALSMAIARFGVDIWTDIPGTVEVSLSSQGSIFEPYSKCLSLVPNTHAYTSVAIITAALLLTYDTFVFGIIMLKTYQHAAEMRKHSQTSITEVLLRDGALYFFTVTALGLTDLGLILSVQFGHNTQTAALINNVMLSYLSVFPNILVNHLYLNLRAMNTTSTSRGNTLPEPAFAQNRFLGNIGAPIDRDPDWWNTPFDDDEDVQSGPQVSVAPSGSEGITTLVPVVYDGDDTTGDIEMVRMRRDTSAAGLSGDSSGMV